MKAIITPSVIRLSRDTTAPTTLVMYAEDEEFDEIIRLLQENK